ncbi:MAG: DUF4271 domain-containing protein [Chitinophagaceae bacterium]
MKHIILFFLSLLQLLSLSAQDSTAFLMQDSAAAVQPFVEEMHRPAAIVSIDSAMRVLLQSQPIMKFSHKADALDVQEKIKIVNNQAWLFYYLLTLSLMFGLVLASQRKYFSDLFRVFFRTSLRIQQIREQLVQSGLPSLLFNLFFFFGAGTFVFLLLRHAGHPALAQPYRLLSGAVLFMATLYAGKFIFLYFSGWIFGLNKIIETYIFIVFMVNKVVGVLLLPFLMVLAFAPQHIASVAVTIALVLVGGLFLYRYLRAYGPVSRETKLSRFHFLLYLLACEVAPILVIYRVFALYF